MKLTKNQLYTIVSTICYNETQKLIDTDKKKRESKAVIDIVTQANLEFSKVSDVAWRISQWKYCNRDSPRPNIDTLIDGAMRELWLKENTELPRGFKEQIELKVQMSMVDAKDLNNLEKKVGYKFVIV